jgi:hypothetical protein
MNKTDKQASTGTTRDARGRSAALLDPYILRLTRRFEVIPEDALEGIAEDLGSGMHKSLRVMFVIAIACVVIGLFALGNYSYQWLTGGVTSSTLKRKLFGMVIVWYGPIMIWYGAKRVRMQRVVSVMLEHRRCPHCGYDLRLLPTDPADRTTVCPECGHAWHLPENTGGPDARS